MKARKLAASLAAIVIASGGFSQAAAHAQKTAHYQGGPGIAVSGASNRANNLPAKAKSFLNKHFEGVQVVKCETFFSRGENDVELSNGIDIEFNKEGRVIEIEAPDNTYLSKAVVRDLLHAGAYRRLEKDGVADRVESIDFDKRGRTVEIEVDIEEPDVYVFDIGGNFIAITD